MYNRRRLVPMAVVVAPPVRAGEEKSRWEERRTVVVGEDCDCCCMAHPLRWDCTQGTPLQGFPRSACTDDPTHVVVAACVPPASFACARCACTW
jgi:hypothetical protein